MRRPDVPKVEYDPVAEMAAFDKLPERIRSALNNGPIKYIGLHQGGWQLWIKEVCVDRAAQLIRAGKAPSVKVDCDCN